MKKISKKLENMKLNRKFTITLHLCRILRSAVYNVKPRKSTKSNLFSVDRR